MCLKPVNRAVKRLKRTPAVLAALGSVRSSSNGESFGGQRSNRRQAVARFQDPTAVFLGESLPVPATCLALWAPGTAPALQHGTQAPQGQRPGWGSKTQLTAASWKLPVGPSSRRREDMVSAASKPWSHPGAWWRPGRPSHQQPLPASATWSKAREGRTLTSAGARPPRCQTVDDKPRTPSTKAARVALAGGDPNKTRPMLNGSAAAAWSVTAAALTPPRWSVCAAAHAFWTRCLLGLDACVPDGLDHLAVSTTPRLARSSGYPVARRADAGKFLCSLLFAAAFTAGSIWPPRQRACQPGRQEVGTARSLSDRGLVFGQFENPATGWPT